MRRSLRAFVASALLAVGGLAVSEPTVEVAAPPVEVAAPPREAATPQVAPSESAGSSEAPAWDRRISDLISPGPLALGHLELEGVTRCNDCHAWLRGTPDSTCLECHEEIGERMEARRGFHGELEGSCAGCHTDHRGREADLLGLDRDGFAHDQALFALRGAHVEVDCDDCHRVESKETGRKAFHPIGIPMECVACHESPHAERLTRDRDCEACHVAAAWDAPVPVDPAGGFGFEHDADTRFALDALHESVACASCHEPEAKAPPARECETCHPDAAALLAGRFDGRKFAPDPHSGTTTCAECHPAGMTSPTLFEYAAVCTDCHPGSYAPLLATRRALLDEALVAARRKAKSSVDRQRLERLARSGLHHPELAEALALELAADQPP